VSIAIGDEHQALAAAVRRFVSERCPPAAVRAVVDSGRHEVPAFHAELAALGWLGLHVPVDCGGEGFGLSEAAIVVEELGRAVAPGPLLPTFWAGARSRCCVRWLAARSAVPSRWARRWRVGRARTGR
jgi:alkylation response protein AidB-like acyl-CoA dehydrogenase